ncbi:MAG: hypothetical protein GY756_19885 [bacterium]|nr:hypothetical protein [bacterium]
MNFKLKVDPQPATVNDQHTANSEKGIATIFVLGIVTLLMVLGISFVDISILEKKASINYNSSVTSQISAESALSRAIGLMRIYSNKPSADYSEIMSYHDLEGNETLNEYTDGLEKLSTTINGVTYYSYDSNSDPITWIYLKNDEEEINSRIAYVVIPNQGKIDPSVAVDSGYNAKIWKKTPPPEGNNKIGADGKPDSLKKEITMVDNKGKYIIGRPGRSINELFLRTLKEDNKPRRKHKWKDKWWWDKLNKKPWFTNKYANNLSSILIRPKKLKGKLQVGKRWSNYSDIFSSLNITKNDTKNKFKEVFYINQPKSPEAYWIDKSNDNLKSPAELYHRFNLARSDWDSFNNKINDSPLLNEPVSFSETDTEKINDAGIEWLRNWQEAGDFVDTERARNQIAANLIDYNDTNSLPTSDYDSTEGKPTYFGNEKSLYLNEYRMQLDFSLMNSQSQSEVHAYFKFDCFETVNLFSLNYSPKFKVAAKIYLEWKNGNHATLNYPEQGFLMISNSMRWNSDYGSNNNGITFAYPFQNSGANVSLGTGTTLKASIDTIRIEELTIELYNGDKIVDIAYLVDANNMYTITDASQNNKLGTKYANYVIDFEAIDPMQNLFSNNWSRSFKKIYPGNSWKYYNRGGSLGSNNNAYAMRTKNTETGVGRDLETSDVKDLSTAYIRNASMKSPWELGFINRGATWQTINLKKFNDDDDQGVKEGAGGDEYALGDANILNQIKMSDDTETYGKINVNSDNVDVLKVLFQKIRVGSFEAVKNTSKYPGWLTKNEIEADDAEELANNLLELYEKNKYKYFNSRAEILKDSNDFIELLTGTDDSLKLDQDNDAKQEEIIGKFINLTKASQGNLFTVIALGETIKDIGEVTINNIETDKGRFDLGADKILSSQKIFAIIKKDPKTNKFSILEFKYINE